MTDRPILFSTPMIRALLTGRKTQTRRLFKPQPEEGKDGMCTCNGHLGNTNYLMRDIAPKHWVRIKVGDRLWVRENAAVRHQSWHHTDGDKHQVCYRADEDEHGRWLGLPSSGSTIRSGKAPSVFPRKSHNVDGSLRWQPSIHMPRWASRLTLTVTEVRVERLQECSEADAIAEGIEPHKSGWMPYSTAFYDGDGITPANYHADPRISYMQLWDSINGQGAWDANPWIVAYTFTVERGNIDKIARDAA